MTANIQHTPREFDHRILLSMASTYDEIDVFAYRSARDLSTDSNRLTSAPSGDATYIRLELRYPTLISPEEFSASTSIGVDISASNYPHGEPTVWALAQPFPWSPHWHPQSGRFCIGPFWRAHNGRALLGDLVTHIARILNWDEKFAKGYLGWNPAAVAEYWRRDGQPLRPERNYPVVPAVLIYGLDRPTFSFSTPGRDGGAFSVKP